MLSCAHATTSDFVNVVSVLLTVLMRMMVARWALEISVTRLTSSTRPEVTQKTSHPITTQITTSNLDSVPRLVILIASRVTGVCTVRPTIWETGTQVRWKCGGDLGFANLMGRASVHKLDCLVTALHNVAESLLNSVIWYLRRSFSLVCSLLAVTTIFWRYIINNVLSDLFKRHASRLGIGKD